MTVLESLKNRAGLIVTGAASFIVVIGGMRLAAGEPLLQPQSDVGVVLGVALVALFFLINDRGRAIMHRSAADPHRDGFRWLPSQAQGVARRASPAGEEKAAPYSGAL